MKRAKRFTAVISTALLTIVVVPGLTQAAEASTAPVGSGFSVTTGDLAFILKQIKIAERHTTTLSAEHPCSTLLRRPGDGIPDAEQVPDILTAYGLRTVDGSCNNLKDGDENYAAADQVFPRLTRPIFKDAEPITRSLPVGAPGPTSYKQKSGNIVDSQPRVISNLIDDQTSTNPAAVAAAAYPVRTQNAPGKFPCTTDPDLLATPPVVGVPANCVPSHQTLFIPNVTTDAGQSPPYNSLFTFFGQFFDHGIDQTVKSGGAVFVPLKADDPLVTLGPDGRPNTGDEVAPRNAFMVLTRAQNQPGPDGIRGTADDIQDASNTDTPWVDQSQTYSSHPSHQVFLRQYALDADNHPVSTGRLLGGLPAGQTYLNSPDGTDGMATWAAVKKQAAQLLGLQLADRDVTNVPMVATDPYGKFLPGPARGLPQYVTSTGMVEGNLASPVPVPADALHFDTPFVADIAHNADPSEQDTNNDGVPDAYPTPDADSTPSADFAQQPAGTYDDEMLGAHFACGDGRCNENIALSAIHQIFHSEHDRMVGYIKNVLESDTSSAGVTALAQWKARGVQGANGTGGYDYGERLFQAARFVTEMEYQHLVFEEFARKVQPGVRPFQTYSPDVNPAISAEFAHAVYRFGHSMLDDTVARTNGDGSDNSTPLLTAFLNPPEYFNGGSAGTLSPKAAAGSIVMGSSNQVGNELDEFVTETLRNNLLGLPLDLPTLNLARAREAGVPPLNDVRRQIFADTNDGQLAPYTSWSDFGQHLKHPESLINFVAAYGTHPSITSETTLAGKRAAARAIVDPRHADPTATPPVPADVPPADAADFMYGVGAWANNASGVTTTGLDDVDLWVGGLAEATNLDGGLLGSTFNYVFQTQLEDLQDGDRLYYLARTPGLNLRTQLESNSFSELIERNTDNTNSLKADAFATVDCKFQLANLAGTPTGFAAFGSKVSDDPTTTDCDESKLLLRKPDGTIQYRATNSESPSGTNFQAVYNGTSEADRVYGGNDDDTLWGNAGKDVIEGGGGNDVALGGEGNDIITDTSGDDVPKGGPGNDAIDAGVGNDISMGGDGADFVNGGANDNETFAGPGNDYIIAGQGADAAYGDGGDDWIEGGTGQDVLHGDHGAPYADDPGESAPGNDVLIGQAGDNDYDAEGGDDILAQNAAVDANNGAGGFDWASHQYDTVGANDDLAGDDNLHHDSWQEVEAVSGGQFNDVIKGNDGALSTPRLVGGSGSTGCDALDQAGVARIKGLADLLPPVGAWRGSAAQTASLSTPGTCPLAGPVWGDGDVLLGGTGSDTFTGRAGDDIIDGDKELRVAISVRTNPADPATEIGTTDLMEHQAVTGNFGPGTAGMTLQAAVFAGLVDPGNLVSVRQIVNLETHPADCAAGAPLNCDTAVYAGPRSRYVITPNSNGSITVADTTSTPASVGVAATGDGSDTLFNIDRLQFADQTVLLKVPSAPTIGVATAGNASASVRWTASPSAPAATSFSIDVRVGTTVVRTVAGVAGSPVVITGLTNGTSYNFVVHAVNSAGAGLGSAPSNTVTPAGLPGTPAIGAATAANAAATASWLAPASDGGSPLVRYEVRVVNAANVQVGPVRTAAPSATSLLVTGLANGVAVRFQVRAVNALGSSAYSDLSAAVTPAVPDRTAPTLLARAPAANALQQSPTGNVLVLFSEAVQPASVTTASFTVRVGTGAAVPATVTYNATTHVATLDPAATLAGNTTYTVSLTAGIKDLAGNAFTSMSWAFRTASR